jgi:pimeloyl-ACP methyl ester carboxylesterase
MFFKVMKTLGEHFRLIMVDMIGMGGSSRPDFDFESYKEADKFLIDCFENWRAKLGLTEFILAGHSFGGYMAGIYAAAYPQYILKLLLLSPLGVF